jgi:hypothetical protein
MAEGDKVFGCTNLSVEQGTIYVYPREFLVNINGFVNISLSSEYQVKGTSIGTV